MKIQKQKTHEQHLCSTHDLEIIIIADHLNSPENYGMLVRTAEAMGVKKVIFLSDEFDDLTSKMKRCARSAENNIEVEFVAALEDKFKVLLQENFEFIGLEICDQSTAIQNHRSSNKKLALIVGNERSGISTELLQLCDKTLHIPMYGQNSSMNVVMATGIALFSLIHCK